MDDLGYPYFRKPPYIFKVISKKKDGKLKLPRCSFFFGVQRVDLFFSLRHEASSSGGPWSPPYRWADLLPRNSGTSILQLLHLLGPHPRVGIFAWCKHCWCDLTTATTYIYIWEEIQTILRPTSTSQTSKWKLSWIRGYPQSSSILDLDVPSFTIQRAWGSPIPGNHHPWLPKIPATSQEIDLYIYI